MRIIEPGHVYELDNLDESAPQRLSFICKAPVSPDATELEMVHDGTTNEEVLKMLIDRMQFLHAKLPRRQSAITITNIREA